MAIGNLLLPITAVAYNSTHSIIEMGLTCISIVKNSSLTTALVQVAASNKEPVQSGILDGLQTAAGVAWQKAQEHPYVSIPAAALVTGYCAARALGVAPTATSVHDRLKRWNPCGKSSDSTAETEISTPTCPFGYGAKPK